MLSAKPWRAEAVIRLLLSLMVCFCAGSLMVALMHHGAAARPLTVGQMIVAALSFQGAVLLLVTRFLREHGTTWREGFGLPQQWHRAILFGFICASLFLPLGWGLQWVSAQTMLHLPKLHLK